MKSDRFAATFDREAWARRANEIRARVPLSKVFESVWKGVKLERGGNSHEWVVLCPYHNEKTASGTINDKKGFFHCFGCGEHHDAIGLVMTHQGLTYTQAIELLEGENGLAHLKAAKPAALAPKVEQREDLDKARRVRRMVETALPIKPGDPVDRYLRGRGLRPLAEWIGGELAEWCAETYRSNAGWALDLRFEPECYHGLEQRRLPAMIAAQRRAGELRSVHRTYLKITGVGVTKAGTARDKAMYGDPAGTFILLGPVTDRMIGGEGIETSGSAGQLFKRSPLAFGSRASMAKTSPPFECSDFLYAADRNKSHPDPKHSRVGEAAARAGAAANGTGRRVGIKIPALPGDGLGDFNDMLQIALGLKTPAPALIQLPKPTSTTSSKPVKGKPAPVDRGERLADLEREREATIEQLEGQRQAAIATAAEQRQQARQRFMRARRARSKVKLAHGADLVAAAQDELRAAGEAFQAACRAVDRARKTKRRVA